MRFLNIYIYIYIYIYIKQALKLLQENGFHWDSLLINLSFILLNELDFLFNQITRIQTIKTKKQH